MAYTKYSLTPADNNAAPPNGAPEGMLPSAVNDTMRDMMAQIRDVGDGIRGGTYTMTAPVITGGSISGLSSLASTGVATFSAGTSSAPSITTTGDTNTGIFFPAADTIAFTVGAAAAMRINSSANVGVNTTNPISKLDVYGASGVTSFTGTTRLGLTVEGATSTNDYSGIDFTSSANPPRARIAAFFSGSGSLLQFGTSNNYGSGVTNTAMTIDPSGNVGIGVTPSTRLDISGGTGGARVQLALSSAEMAYYSITPANDAYLPATWRALTHQWFTGTSERMRIGSGGSLQVGTTSDNGNVANNALVVAGQFRSLSGSGGITNGGFLTLFTIPVNSTWIISLQTGNASGLATVGLATYVSGGNPVALTILKVDNGAFTLTFSGTSMLASNNLGGTVVASWTAIRIS